MSFKRPRTSFSGGYPMLFKARRALSRLPGMVRSAMRARRMSALSRGVIAARVHQFKRMGAPFIIQSAAGLGTPAAPTAVGNSGLSIGTVSAGATANSLQFPATLYFALSQIANKDEITSLFDNYRITKVSLKFILSIDGAQLSPTSAGGSVVNGYLPVLHITPDIDDSTLPNNREEVLQNSYAKSLRLGDNIFTMSVVPRVQSTVAQNPTTNVAGGLLARGTWLDSGSPDIRMYGVKMWFDQWLTGFAASQAMTLQIIPTYYIEAKNVV